MNEVFSPELWAEELYIHLQHIKTERRSIWVQDSDEVNMEINYDLLENSYFEIIKLKYGDAMKWIKLMTGRMQGEIWWCNEWIKLMTGRMLGELQQRECSVLLLSVSHCRFNLLGILNTSSQVQIRNSIAIKLPQIKIRNKDCDDKTNY